MAHIGYGICHVVDVSTTMAYVCHSLDLYVTGVQGAYMTNNKPLYKGQG